MYGASSWMNHIERLRTTSKPSLAGACTTGRTPLTLRPSQQHYYRLILPKSLSEQRVSKLETPILARPPYGGIWLLLLLFYRFWSSPCSDRYPIFLRRKRNSYCFLHIPEACSPRCYTFVKPAMCGKQSSSSSSARLGSLVQTSSTMGFYLSLYLKTNSTGCLQKGLPLDSSVGAHNLPSRLVSLLDMAGLVLIRSLLHGSPSHLL